MDRFNDLQQLWCQVVPAPAVHAKEIIHIVRKQRRAMLLRMAGSIGALLVTLPVMAWVFISYQPVYPTTRFSIVLCSLAVIAAIIVQGSFLKALISPLKEDVSNKAMLTALQKLQLRQKKFNARFISAYFLVLSIAMALYLFEFIRGNVWFGIASYTLTFGWIAIAWFYLRPRAVKKQNASLDSMINHLNALQQEWEE